MGEISESVMVSASGAVAAAGESYQPSQASVKVWLVDDNDHLRTMIAELLGLQGGIDCARHFSSPDALLSALASKPGPDVILLDVQMGDRNGLDAVRPIKSLTRSTRVLMFTTCFNPEWRARALREGASDYLLKSEAMDRVAEHIRCPAEDSNPNTVYRRRARRPADRAAQARPSLVNPSPRLLSRTLGRLRNWWN